MGFVDKETLVSIYEEFETESSGILEDCKKSFLIGDFKTIQGHLHTLKGSAGTLGIKEVENISRKIEGNLKQNVFENITEGLQELYLAFEDFKNQYNTLIQAFLEGYISAKQE